MLRPSKIKVRKPTEKNSQKQTEYLFANGVIYGVAFRVDIPITHCDIHPGKGHATSKCVPLVKCAFDILQAHLSKVSEGVS